MTDQKKEKQVKRCTEPNCNNELTTEFTTMCEKCFETARAAVEFKSGRKSS